MNKVLDKIIEFIENECYEENQSVYGYGWEEMDDVVNAQDLVKFINSLKESGKEIGPSSLVEEQT